MRADVREYDVAVPRDLDEALAHVADAPGRWTPLAGGTDLMVVLAAGHLQPCALLSIWHLGDSLRQIRVERDRVVLGALVTYSDVQRHPVLQAEFPMLGEAARLSGALAIQSRGTLAGNVANASPAADTPPALFAYGAQIELASRAGRRTVPYATFHTGYKTTVRAADELITAVILPRPTAARVDVYRKVGTRKAQAIAKVGLAASVSIRGGVIEAIGLGLSSVAPTPLCAAATAAALLGRTPADALADGLDALQREVVPIDDVRSNATYRRAIAVRLLRDVLEALARGEHPAPPL